MAPQEHSWGVVPRTTTGLRTRNRHATRNPNPAIGGGFPAAQRVGPVPILSRRWLDWGFTCPMRIRTIKPEFWESESLGRVSREARLLFIGLFSCCDDTGRARASSRLLASRLYPYDDDAFKKLPGWIAELQSEGCIRIYQVDGESYLDIPKWQNHQKIDKPSASKLPPFEPPRKDSRGFEKDCSGMGTGNREQGEEQGTGNKEPEVASAPRVRFVPPTREELNLEAEKVGIPPSEVDKFVAYYGSNGWRVGKVQMKSWTHALAGWASRWRERQHQGRQPQLIGTNTPDDSEF